jgi:hypothetical protein
LTKKVPCNPQFGRKSSKRCFFLSLYVREVVTKKRELEREIWRNTDTTSQGTHADPNRIRAAWSSNLHQTPLSQLIEHSHTQRSDLLTKMIYSYVDQHIGSQNTDLCALHRIKQSRNYFMPDLQCTLSRIQQ